MLNRNRVEQRSVDNRFKAVTGPKVFSGSKRYKEVWYGVAMGVSVWMLDAAMHASVHRQFNWSGFAKEIIATDSAQLLFRTLFVIVSTAFGISIWRSNQRKSRIQDLNGAFDSLYRRIANPLVLIVGYSQMLSLKEGWPVGREAIEIVDEIQFNARRINEVIERLPPPGMPDEEEPFAKLGLDQPREASEDYELRFVQAIDLSNNKSPRGM